MEGLRLVGVVLRTACVLPLFDLELFQEDCFKTF